MEDEFQLISKADLQNLRDKVKNINNNSSEVKTVEPKANNESLIKDIVKAIQDEGKKEREMILENLTHIKDLNKTTLTNVLDRTDKLDTRIGSLVDTIGELVGSIKDMVEDTGKNSMNKDLKEIVAAMKKGDMPESSNNGEILEKLAEVETFMENLKILLGQIQPHDVHYK